LLVYFLSESTLYCVSFFRRHRPVKGSQQVSRFAFESNKIKSSGVDFRLFVPARNSPTELSTSLTRGLSEDRIWSLGDAAGGPRGKTAIGRADLENTRIEKLTPLRVIHDVPPRRHALLANWPSNDIEHQKSIAQLLAREARVQRRNT
jgi:hypothetical protein